MKKLNKDTAHKLVGYYASEIEITDISVTVIFRNPITHKVIEMIAPCADAHSVSISEPYSEEKER
jgi:predicted RNA binding protein with dsRBD fold (UPF0201 family)